MKNTEKENIAVSTPAEKAPEIIMPDTVVNIEQVENLTTFEKTKEVLGMQVNEKIGELKNSANNLEQDIKISGGSEDQVEEFKEDLQKIDEKAIDAKDEYENSFITPGVIESRVEEKKSESFRANIPEKKDDKNMTVNTKEQESNLCPECGRDTGSGSFFCMSCGSGLSKSDRMKKAAREVIPNMDDKSKAVTRDYYKRTTEELKGEYPGTIDNMETIAKNVGFKNFYVKDFDTYDAAEGRSKNFIHVEPNNYGKEAVFFPKKYLKNHQILEDLDKDRTKVGLTVIMQHEKEHCEDFAKRAANIGVEIETKEEYRDHLEKVAKETNLDSDEVHRQIKATNKWNKKMKESQVNTQSIVRNLEDGKDKEDMRKKLVEKIATSGVYADGLQAGIAGLKADLKSKSDYSAIKYYADNYRGLSKKVITDIIGREKDIKADYIYKYNKKYGIVDEESNK